MRSAGIAEAKAQLSRLLGAVRAGEEVVITERGRPVARLVAAGQDPERPSDADDLVRAGQMKRAKSPIPRRFYERVPGAEDAQGSVLSALLEEREGGR